MYSINVDFHKTSKQKISIWKSTYYTSWDNDKYGDFRFPFREVIDKIIVELSKTFDEIELDIEPFEYGEDFISFTLTINDSILDGYFEYSLCYLSFEHKDKSLLNQFRKIANQVQFHSNGYEGDLGLFN